MNAERLFSRLLLGAISVSAVVLIVSVVALVVAPD
ncbi:hypothetical protein JOD63_001430 [Microbacterium terrae]|uniref:Uncharacterized protein n=1 Tax=Microbacterium terrae TaxID=69369 RepID=A0A0M2GWV2_9MICO|nr:hypothetical protein RS81_03048 [Microbacterium terrae]MBP1077462.1 hypothetical protein [Microbacterium terrae]